MIIAISRLFLDYFRINTLINRSWTFDILRSGKIVVSRKTESNLMLILMFELSIMKFFREIEGIGALRGGQDT